MTKAALWTIGSCPLYSEALRHFCKNYTTRQIVQLVKFTRDHEKDLESLELMRSWGPEQIEDRDPETFYRLLEHPDIPSEIKVYPPRPNKVKRVPIPQPTWIYLMKCNRTGLFKIGRSINPSFRESTLQAEAPDIELFKKWEGTEDQEAELHEQFSTKRVRGEWFRLTPEDIDIILSETAKEVE